MRRVYCVVVSSLVLAMAGCSSQPFANLTPCQGTITFDGQPLDHGTVSFDPVDKKVGQSATGIIENGHFIMATTESAPGVVAGKYKVSVLCPTKNPEPPEPGEPLPALASLIPEKYTSTSTSGFEVEVKKGMAPVVLKLEKDKE